MGTRNPPRRARASHQALRESVKKLHLRFIRQINDVHIFAQQAVALLSDAKAECDGATEQRRKYYIPSFSAGQKAAKRSDEEMRELYDRFVSRDLYENLIVAGVSRCESYLFDVAREVFRAYPEKMNVSIKGMDPERTVPLKLVLEAGSIDELIEQVVAARLGAVSYASPKSYLEFLKALISIDTEDKAFVSFVEIKATRDLLVHGSGLINDIYLIKCQTSARGARGEQIKVDRPYFDHCVAIFRRVSYLSNKSVSTTFRG